MKSKKKYIIYIIIFSLIIGYFIDREIYMKKRVMAHNLWENTGGERIKGDGFETQNVFFKKDTMFFYSHHLKRNDDTLIFIWQYFSSMKVMDPSTKKTGIYSMKGGNFTDYLFKKHTKRENVFDLSITMNNIISPIDLKLIHNNDILYDGNFKDKNPIKNIHFRDIKREKLSKIRLIYMDIDTTFTISTIPVHSITISILKNGQALMNTYLDMKK